MKLRTDALALQEAMKPEDDAGSMETLGWLIVLGVVVSTALMHVARGVVSVHARAAKALLVTPGHV